jgi:hypothetical protein
MTLKEKVSKLEKRLEQNEENLIILMENLPTVIENIVKQKFNKKANE